MIACLHPVVQGARETGGDPHGIENVHLQLLVAAPGTTGSAIHQGGDFSVMATGGLLSLGAGAMHRVGQGGGHLARVVVAEGVQDLQGAAILLGLDGIHRFLQRAGSADSRGTGAQQALQALSHGPIYWHTRALGLAVTTNQILEAGGLRHG